MSNIIDLAEIDIVKVLTAIEKGKAGEIVCCDDMTIIERNAVAKGMGWDRNNPSIQNWING